MEAISNIIQAILHYSFVNPNLHPVLFAVQESARWFLITGALFIPLAMAFPGKPGQPRFRRDMLTDAVYWFAGPHVYGPVAGIMVAWLVSTDTIHFINTDWALGRLPTLVQAVLILLISDVLQYWLHRIFHGQTLWKFHAIHHSSENVDWMSSARFHPVNIILYSTSVNALVATLGFTPAAFEVLTVFNAIYSPLVHANLNWTYGPFRYVLASPVFHRWHHTMPDEGGNKNFAPTFPFLDLMFGTFYMPSGGVQPENFGIAGEKMQDGLLGQLIYPFHTPKGENPPTGQDLSSTPDSAK